MKNKNTQKGFTLIELMIVVAILGILSAIALPSYTRYVEKSRRTDAKIELLKIAQLQESYFAQNLSYANSLTQLGFASDSMDSEDGYYDLSVSAVSSANCNTGANPACITYEITAAPDTSEAQNGDSTCTGFRIDNVGRKKAKGHGHTSYGNASKADECWGK